MLKETIKDKPILEGYVTGTACMIIPLLGIFQKDYPTFLMIIFGLIGISILSSTLIIHTTKFNGINEFVTNKDNFEKFRAWVTFSSMLLIPFTLGGIIFFFANLNELRTSLIKPKLELLIHFDSKDERFEFQIKNNSEVLADSPRGIVRSIEIPMKDSTKIEPMKFSDDFILSGDGSLGYFTFTKKERNHPITKGRIVIGCRNCRQSFYHFYFSTRTPKHSFYIESDNSINRPITEHELSKILMKGTRIPILTKSLD